MLRQTGNRCGNKISIAGVLLASAILAGGCSSVSNLISPPSNPPAPQADAQALPGSAPAPGASAAVASAQSGTGLNDYECPAVSVRTGTATLTVGDKPAATESSPMALKYQGSIVRTARECQFRTGTVTMKVGIEGRVVTGPAGGAGQFDVPLRIAVVREGPEPKTVLSKFVRVPVVIPEGSGGVTFTHIDPEIAYPLPVPAADIEAYVVYVGFDPAGVPPEKTKARAKTRSSKPRR